MNKAESQITLTYSHEVWKLFWRIGHGGEKEREEGAGADMHSSSICAIPNQLLVAHFKSQIWAVE